MVKKVTLRDVAKHAGVSVTTVSNVVRGWPHVTESTRAKVTQSIHELGYIPNPFAQGLRSGRTHTIGFIVPDIGSPHFGALVSIVEDIAHEHGYGVLVVNTHENQDREAEGIRRLTNGWSDGILIVQATNALQENDLSASIDVPFVAIDRVPDDFDGAFCNVNNFEVTRLAMQHLVDLGHERIAHLAGPKEALSARSRLAAYLDLVQYFGLKYHYVSASSRWSSEDGYRATLKLLAQDPLPTAIFASNDRMAIGAVRAIYEHQLAIPDDIALVGVDDIEISQYLQPPLTTIRQPVEEMARIGIEMLLELIDGKQPEQLHVSLQPTLIVRDSTSPCR